MAHDTKPGWSRVFVRPTASGAPHGPRRVRATGREAPVGPSLHETIDEFLAAVEERAARDRYGRPFSPEAARDLRWYLSGHVAEALGAMSLGEVRRRDVEALVYELGDSGMPRDRLRALARSVRALYDYAIERRLARGNPAERIAIPDNDEPPPPARPVPPAREQGILDHLISLALRVATLGFVLTALIFLAESL
jgi:site-specific recombinase XerC